MRSIREGGAGEHADYWVFLKTADSEFHAYKVFWFLFSNKECAGCRMAQVLANDHSQDSRY